MKEDNISTLITLSYQKSVSSLAYYMYMIIIHLLLFFLFTHMKQEILRFIIIYGFAVVVGTLFVWLITSVFANDWSDTPEFSYSMEQSMNRLECAYRGYADPVRCFIFLNNK